MDWCLIITHSKDKTVDYMENILNMNLRIFRFNLDELSSYNICIENSETKISKVNNCIYSKDIKSIYYRKTKFPNIHGYDQLYHSFMYKEMLMTINGLAEYLGDICLTRPSILSRAENKILQMHIADQIGLVQPSSLITNDSKKANDFLNTVPSIIKPIASGKIKNKDGNWGFLQTNFLQKGTIVDNIENSPSYFQEYLNKSEGEYRIVICGFEIYAVQIISSNEVDWRKKGSANEYKIVDLPNEIIEKCLKLMKILNIDFGAFDFIKRNGEFYFLEVNPNGEWLWLELNLGIRISHSITNYLLGR